MGNITLILTYDFIYLALLHKCVFFLFIISLLVIYNYLYFILFHTHPRYIYQIQWTQQNFKTEKLDCPCETSPFTAKEIDIFTNSQNWHYSLMSIVYSHIFAVFLLVLTTWCEKLYNLHSLQVKLTPKKKTMGKCDTHEALFFNITTGFKIKLNKFVRFCERGIEMLFRKQE